MNKKLFFLKKGIVFICVFLMFFGCEVNMDDNALEDVNLEELQDNESRAVKVSYSFPLKEDYGLIPYHTNYDTLARDVNRYYVKWRAKYYGEFNRRGKRCGYVKQWDYNYAHEQNSSLPMWIPMTYTEGGKTYGSYGTSEGLGYGMLISVMMAGSPSAPNAKRDFDRMLNTYYQCPSSTGSGLMSWVLPTSYRYPTSTSATDGDMDVAYALICAYNKWNNKDYLRKARNIMKIITRKSILKLSSKYANKYHTFRIALADDIQNKPSSAIDYYTRLYGGTRSSDWMPGHMMTFYSNFLRMQAGAFDRAIWKEVRKTTYGMIEHIEKWYSSSTGLMPDFVEGKGWKPNPMNGLSMYYQLKPAAPKFAFTDHEGNRVYLESVNDGKYDYNACRYPWRMASALPTFHATNGWSSDLPIVEDALRRISTWVKSAHPDPKTIVAGYELNGTPTANWKEMSFTSSLLSSFISKSSGDRSYLWDGWKHIRKISSDSHAYYNDTITLLNMILISGNWFSPPPCNT